jgi:pSer/pThr/pTyr-binding forkhead associated (FHA) protein
LKGYFEVWEREGRRVVALERDLITIGRSPDSHIAFPDDPTVSRQHAVVERYPNGWAIRDLASANGTFVNTTPILAEHGLRPGDEVVIGDARLVFHSVDPIMTGTVSAERPPELTKGEREVLVALCRPLLHGGHFREPASVAQIAEATNRSEATVKFHVGNLYAKFGIEDEGASSRRVRLANEALRRRAVTLADLHEES